MAFQAAGSTQVTIGLGLYFIGKSRDRNTHDLDDIVVSPMSVALYGEKDLWSKVLHFHYNNNILGEGKTNVVATKRASSSNF